GAAPVVAALDMGATVVVAGRVTDTGVTLAPMIHELGWAADDWDRIAAGIVGGHIIECGTQATGGNFTDWKLGKSRSNIGYPLLEASEDGSLVVTKHPGTGGLVSVHTVTEQLVYEMGSPAYLSPDCVAHFDSMTLTHDGPDRVRGHGVRRDPHPEAYKVPIHLPDGYRAFGRLLVSGPDALAKADDVAAQVWESVGGPGLYEEAVTQVIGWNGSHPPLTDTDPSEVLLQVAVRDADRAKIGSRFCPQ